MARIAIITGARAPALTDDGQALADAFRARGYTVTAARWDRDHDWSRVDAALLRSCFEYYERPEAFHEWLSAVEDAGVTVRNPPGIVRWNAHKSYLLDLAAAGVDVLDTLLIDRGASAELAALLADRGWEEAVVKPAVGTSSAGVWRTTRERAAADQPRFERDLAGGDVLVQRFAPEIRDGERSLVFLGGEFSHATRCVPAEGEFRSHHQFGGESTPFDPSDGLVTLATDTLRVARDVVGIDSPLPYARVDGIERDGRFMLMELELVEPYLNLRDAGAVDRMADAVVASLADAAPPPPGVNP